MEQYIKLDLNKWLKVLRHLELLPRPLGQDWSKIWLQRFSGTITIWPKTVPSDLYYILSDPSPQRLGRMIREGKHSTFPKLKFISNRMKLEKIITEGVRKYPTPGPSVTDRKGEKQGDTAAPSTRQLPWEEYYTRPTRREMVDLLRDERSRDTSVEDKGKRKTGEEREKPSFRRRSSMVEELRRQTAVFFDDPDDSASHDEDGDLYKEARKIR